MNSASRLFYLHLFALWASPSAASPPDGCAISSKNLVGDACVSYATLDKLNGLVKPALDDLTTTTDFFSHYRLNLFHKSCPFWDDGNGMCGNIGCAVETLDNEDDIPDVWKAHELGKLEGPSAAHPGKQERIQRPNRPLQGKLGEGVGESCVVEDDDECDERDYCVPDDESATSKGDYVSLLRNPERFTGYSGDGAKQVWDAIYRENCFQKSSFPSSASLGLPQSPAVPAAHDFKHVMEAAGRHSQLMVQRQQNPNMPFVASTGFEVDDECLEKRVFYRVVSGMHASISAHLCYNFLNQTTGEWQPNLSCYLHRLHHFPDRISNLYFNYALVTRAVAKLDPYLRGPPYTFCSGDPGQDEATRAKLMEVTQRAASVPNIFDESIMFVNGEGPSLKEDFRNRFRNISRLMDCVGCDKCRLWGKVQTHGYGTALKVLFEFGKEGVTNPVLKRTELVALFNTYARLGESVKAIGTFRDMLEKKERAEAGEASSTTPVPDADSGRPKSQQGQQPPDKSEPALERYSDEEADEAVRDFVALRRRGPKSRSLRHRVLHEMARFRAAVRIVINGWLRAPKTFWHIISSEATRLYRHWVGLPPGPRLWKVQFPGINRDEL